MAESFVFRHNHFQTLTAANLNFESYRLRTFKRWPLSLIVSAKELARAGFYYMGKENEVVCYSCKERITNWNIGDVPFEKHSRMNTHCSFVRGAAGNVPIDLLLLDMNERLKTFTGRWTVDFIDPVDLAASGFYYFGDSDKVQCAFCFGILMNWKREDTPQIDHKRYFPSCKFFKSVIVYTPPVNVQIGSGSRDRVIQLMQNENERLRTYAEWPLDFINPVSLAKSGFYYLGLCDKVECAYCLGRLNQWEVNDIPDVEHRKFFPLCPFVKSGFQNNLVVTNGQDVCGGENLHQHIFPLPKNNEVKHFSNPPTMGVLPCREKATRGDLKSMKDDLQKLKDKTLCKICMDSEIQVVLIPCGHLVTCAFCSQNINVCPVCREPVENIMRTFMT